MLSCSSCLQALDAPAVVGPERSGSTRWRPFAGRAGREPDRLLAGNPDTRRRCRICDRHTDGGLGDPCGGGPGWWNLRSLCGMRFSGSLLVRLHGVCGRSGCGGENVEGTFEIVRDGGEVNRRGSFGETAPSHAANIVAALPRSKDLFGPASDAMDRPAPGLQVHQRLLLVVTPQACHDHRRRPARRTSSPATRSACSAARPPR